MTKLKLTSRDAIIEAAFQVFNLTPGASLAEIADHAGVGRATLHRHFSARQDLMNALSETARDELNAAVDAAVEDAVSHTDGLRRALSAIIPLANRQWFLSHDFGQTPSDRDAADHLELLNAIKAAQQEGNIAADLPPAWIAEVYDNLIYAAWTMVRKEEATPKQAADLAWRSFIKGVSS